MGCPFPESLLRPRRRSHAERVFLWLCWNERLAAQCPSPEGDQGHWAGTRGPHSRSQWARAHQQWGVTPEEACPLAKRRLSLLARLEMALSPCLGFGFSLHVYYSEDLSFLGSSLNKSPFISSGRQWGGRGGSGWQSADLPLPWAASGGFLQVGCWERRGRTNRAVAFLSLLVAALNLELFVINLKSGAYP